MVLSCVGQWRPPEPDPKLVLRFYKSSWDVEPRHHDSRGHPSLPVKNDLSSNNLLASDAVDTFLVKQASSNILQLPIIITPS